MAVKHRADDFATEQDVTSVDAARDQERVLETLFRTNVAACRASRTWKKSRQFECNGLDDEISREYFQKHACDLNRGRLRESDKV